MLKKIKKKPLKSAPPDLQGDALWRENKAKDAVGQIIAFGKAGDLDKARTCYNEIVTLAASYPGQPFLREAQARGAVSLTYCFGETGDLEQAVGYYKDILALRAEYPEEALLREAQFDGGINLVIGFGMAGDKTTARAYLEEISALQLTSPDKNKQAASTKAIAPIKKHQHPFLRAIRLKNVRGIEDIELNFTDDAGESRQLTLLLGENGVGKTTLLRAIALLTAGTDASTQLIPSPELWIKQGQTSCLMEAVVIMPGGSQNTLKYEIKKGQATDEVQAHNRSNLRPFNRFIAEKNNFYFPVFGYGFSRHLSPEKPNNSARGGLPNPRTQRIASLFFGDRPLYPIQELAKDLYEEDPALASTLLKQTLTNMMRGIECLGVKSLSEGSPPELEILFNVHGIELSLAQLSDGYQTVAALCGDLMHHIREGVRADPNDPLRKNPLDACALILIDEIDIHLHPMWQKELRRFLMDRLPNCQIVATTHSPMVASDAKPGEVICLYQDPETNRIQAQQNKKSLLGLRTDQILTSMFRMETTIHDSFNKDWDRYAELYAKPDRTDQEQTELKQLSEKINTHIPGSEESINAYVASELMEEWMRERLRGVQDTRREQVIKIAKQKQIESRNRSKWDKSHAQD